MSSTISKTEAAASSIAVNVGLLALKATVAAVTGSVALWASAADSLLDLTASLFAYAGVRIAERPPDDTHTYGHHKFESLSSLVQLALLLVTVAFITLEAVQRLREGGGVETPLYGVGVIVVSMVVDAWIVRRLRTAAEQAGGSHALEADALHFATDVWSNLAVLVGLAATAAGVPVADPAAALAVALLVTVTAIGLLRHTTATLTDRAPDEATIAHIIDVIHRVPEVRGHHTLRARMAGRRIFLDLCVELDPELSFERAHDISHELIAMLQREIPAIADVVIHFEPAGHPEHQDDAHHSHGFDALPAKLPRGE